MQILKSFFKIAGKLRGTLIMYFSIFVTVGIIVTNVAPASVPSFEQSRLKVAVFDEDKTAESRALYDFIAEHHDIVEAENDPEKLWDGLYYHSINYVLTIEKGYAEKIRSGDTGNLFTYSVDPQSYSCEYLNMQIRQYVSTISTFLGIGRDFDSAQADALKVLANNTEVTAYDFSGGDSGADSKFTIFMRYLAYVMPCITLSVLSRIIIELRAEEIRNRTFCSPITPLAYNGQIICGSMIFCAAMWIFLLLISMIFAGFPALSENVLLAVLNSFVFMLVSAGIGVLVSMCFSSNSFVIDMITNIICLGMAFLCGVFVDQTLLGEKVLNVGKFLPAYWYVRAADNLGQISGAVFSADIVWQCIGMEALFAAALFAVSLVTARFKRT